MRALSVIGRELRAAARRRSIVWVRVLVAGISTLIAFGVLQFYRVPTGGLGAPQAGKYLLETLAWLTLVFCLAEGARQTSDSLSQENREGTLGLLFLTDLTGFDVAAGKFAAASVMTFYGLIAAFPAMSLALLGGGVTAGEFWRTLLVLLNTLFLSGAVGLFISSRNREESRALIEAAALLLGIVFLPLFAELVSPALAWTSISPAILLTLAGDMHYQTDAARFWLSLVVGNLLAWSLGLAAGRRTSTCWRQEAGGWAPSRKVPSTEGWAYRLGPRLHAALPSTTGGIHLLERHPAAWLAGRTRGLAPLIWLGVLVPLLDEVLIVGHRLGLVSVSSLGSAMMLLHYVGVFLRSGLLAAAAGHLFHHARRSGFLELLLGCPLSAAEVVGGYWNVLWRHLRRPLAVVVLVKGLPVISSLLSASLGIERTGFGMVLWYGLPGLASDLLAPIAACWVALWLGLIFPKMGQVVGRTFALITLAPWLMTLLFPLVMELLAFFDAMVARQAQTWVPWWGLIQTLAIVWFAGLIWWARRCLIRNLREAAAAPESFHGRSFWRGRSRILCVP